MVDLVLQIHDPPCSYPSRDLASQGSTKYFAGVVPFMDPQMIAERVYLNIYWDIRGNMPAIDAFVAKMRHEFDVTVQCQMDRLRLLCANETFLEAFVMTHITTQFLDTGIEKRLRETFKARKVPDPGATPAAVEIWEAGA